MPVHHQLNGLMHHQLLLTQHVSRRLWHQWYQLSNCLPPEEQQPSEHEQQREEPETVHEPVQKRRYHKVSKDDREFLKQKLIQHPNQPAAFYASQTGIPLHNCRKIVHQLKYGERPKSPQGRKRLLQPKDSAALARAIQEKSEATLKELQQVIKITRKKESKDGGTRT